MNVLGKSISVLGFVGITTIGTLMFLSNSSIQATDEVSVEMFNQLKAEVEVLKQETQSLKEEATILTTENNELKKIVADVEAKVSANANGIEEIDNKISLNINKVTKMEKWHNKLDELLEWEDLWGFRHNADAIFKRLREWKLTQ